MGQRQPGDSGGWQMGTEDGVILTHHRGDSGRVIGEVVRPVRLEMPGDALVPIETVGGNEFIHDALFPFGGLPG